MTNQQDKITAKNILQFNVKTQDEYYTPRYAVLPLLQYIKRGWTIWCPFDLEESNFVRVLSENGFNVVHSHIAEGKDFFTCEIPRNIDAIISNPPYSKKTEVLERLYAIGKPFAMVIGSPGIFESVRFDLFANHGVEIMVFDKRVSYFGREGKTSEKTSPGFSSWYICHNILPAKIVFQKLDKTQERYATDDRQLILF